MNKEVRTGVYPFSMQTSSDTVEWWYIDENNDMQFIESHTVRPTRRTWWHFVLGLLGRETYGL